jgi:hypothetical protein
MQQLGLEPDRAEVEAVEWQRVEFHPIANIFPLMEGEAFEALCSDIKENGLREPIILHEGKVLDGRNRWRACEREGVKPWTGAFNGSDPLAYVVSLNLHRRHLNESQRAMVAERIANMRRGDNPQICGLVSQPQAAEMLQVSERSIQSAAKVRRQGTPDLAAAVERGEVAVSTAASAIDAAEEYPCLKSPHWSPAAVVQAKKALDKIDAGSRNVVAELIEEARDDVKLGVAIAEKVANATERERQDFLRLAQSEDERERDRAATWAASRDPMPDPRLTVYRKCIHDLKESLKRFRDEPEDVYINRSIASLEAAIESIKTRSKGEGK